MLSALFNLCTRGYVFVHTRAPSNRLLWRLRAQPGWRSAGIAVLAGLGYLALAVGCVLLVRAGWTGWLYIGFFLFLYNAAKLGFYAPWSLLRQAALRGVHAVSTRARRP